MIIKGRAETDEQKREVMKKILAAWIKTPTLRLGQLIDNATKSDIFYIEDNDLVDAIMTWIEKL